MGGVKMIFRTFASAAAKSDWISHACTNSTLPLRNPAAANGTLCHVPPPPIVLM